MKVNILTQTLFAALFLFSCAPEVAYQDISEFNIVADAIPNNTSLVMLYSSATPTDEAHLSYFIHLVGIVKDGTDTVNVLTTFNRGDGGGESKNEFKYYTLDSEEGKEYFEALYNEGMEEKHSIEEIASITRVTYDKRFNYVAKNNFPTVIGFIEK